LDNYLKLFKNLPQKTLPYFSMSNWGRVKLVIYA
jgi:hypothetical protein